MQKIKSKDTIIFTVVYIGKEEVKVRIKGHALGRDFVCDPQWLREGDSSEVDIRFEVNG